MAVQPIYLVAYNDDGWHYVARNPDHATHVCFALDDLPDLAWDLALTVDITVPGWLVDLVERRLRGAAPGADDRPDAVPG